MDSLARIGSGISHGIHGPGTSHIVPGKTSSENKILNVALVAIAALVLLYVGVAVLQIAAQALLLPAIILFALVGGGTYIVMTPNIWHVSSHRPWYSPVMNMGYYPRPVHHAAWNPFAAPAPARGLLGMGGAQGGRGGGDYRRQIPGTGNYG